MRALTTNAVNAAMPQGETMHHKIQHAEAGTVYVWECNPHDGRCSHPVGAPFSVGGRHYPSLAAAGAGFDAQWRAPSLVDNTYALAEASIGES